MASANGHIDLNSALERARLKRDVAEMLKVLPVPAREELLVSLLADLELSRDPTPTTVHNAPSVQPEPPQDGETGQGDGDGETKTNRSAVLKALRESPGLPVRDIAIRVYGNSEDASISKVRSILTVLKKQGLVRNPAFGKWTPKKQKEATDK